MKLLTSQEKIKNIAEKWRTNPEQKVWGEPPGTKGKISHQLSALPVTATVEEVEAIIGGITSWTRYDCDECGEDTIAAVEVGTGREYEVGTATLCRGCLEKALALVKAEDGS